MGDDDEINVDLDELEKVVEDLTNSYTIDLSKTYGTTSTYWDGDHVTDVVHSHSNDNISITLGDEYTLSGDFGAIDLDAWAGIKPDDVEKMCKHYPGLEKVWRNFKSVYDMCKQDYEGKKKAGEIDDDIPF